MTKVQVLDHGFVELLDIMGDDVEPARAARISYGNREQEREWDKDAKLTKYLWDNKHTTPFEMIELKWLVKCPLFVARQWHRHRTANINEFSMRYADPSKLSDGIIQYYTPEVWRTTDEGNKQGSKVGDLYFDTGNRSPEDARWWATYMYQNACDDSISLYTKLREAGVANEMARMVLPVSVYTEYVWKNDLHNTLHFIKIRADEHAQYEIRVYAEAMLAIIKERLPRLMEVITI